MTPLGAALPCREVLMRQRFGMSAPKAENGFVPKRIVSSRLARRNIRGKIINIFNVRKKPGFSGRQKFLPPSGDFRLIRST
jgi:hypothetical protein